MHATAERGSFWSATTDKDFLSAYYPIIRHRDTFSHDGNDYLGSPRYITNGNPDQTNTGEIIGEQAFGPYGERMVGEFHLGIDDPGMLTAIVPIKALLPNGYKPVTGYTGHINENELAHTRKPKSGITDSSHRNTHRESLVYPQNKVEHSSRPVRGYREDPTGLIYMKGRYYSPGWHKFINSDQGIDPFSLNQFVYVNGMPFKAANPLPRLLCLAKIPCDP